MINFNLPGLYEHFELNSFFLHYYTIHPEYFNPGVKIASVFGNFPYCTWDGGRNFIYYDQVTKEKIIDVKNMYNSYHVNPRFVFTNPVLEERDLHDRFCNTILNLFPEDNNEIVVNSELLKTYLQENYPNFKLISSTTKCITNLDKALEEIANPDYYQVCIDYNLNKNIEFLESIPKELRSKVEILVNAICPPGCPHRKLHYSETGQAHLTYLKDRYSVAHECKIDQELNHPKRLGQGNNLSFEEIKEYHKMGFQHFKLEGRTLPSGTMFANYLYYLIKPEYHFFLIETAIKKQLFLNTYNDPETFVFTGEKDRAKIGFE